MIFQTSESFWFFFLANGYRRLEYLFKPIDNKNKKRDNKVFVIFFSVLCVCVCVSRSFILSEIYGM